MNITVTGDCRETMRAWAADGVRAQMCVTSPPYFGLRNYGHEGQLGLEQTPEQYIAAMVEVFRCVWDVLADDGTLWLNIGDSYARTGGTDRKVSASAQVGSTRNTMEQMSDRTSKASALGLKDKDLIGIPWMLAFALRADGWFLRQDIIWHKPNPMPESVRDRCTKAHEYLFLLTKREKYFYDAKAIEEPAKWERWGNQTEKKAHQGTAKHLGGKMLEDLPIRDKKNKRSVWSVPTGGGYKGAHCAVYPPALIEPCILAGSRPGDIVLDPFMGSGTTAAVALQHGRQYLGCELNPAYQSLQDARIATSVGPLFA